MALIICLWSNRYFQMINSTVIRNILRIIVLKANLAFKPGFMICKILVVSFIHTGYCHFSSITFKISQGINEILLVGVNADVRSAYTRCRLNTNWPQTHQDFAVDDYSFVEENCHQEPCPTLEIMLGKIDVNLWKRYINKKES